MARRKGNRNGGMNAPEAAVAIALISGVCFICYHTMRFIYLVDHPNAKV